MSSTRICFSMMPAQLTSADNGPRRSVALLEQPDDVGLDSDVGGNRRGAAASRFDIGHDPRRRVAIAAVVHADGVAARRGEARRRRPDAATTARHEQDLVHGRDISAP